MSYARRGPDSDVYVFATDDGFVCHECKLDDQTVTFKRASEMVDHLDGHIENDHKVPPDCVQRLAALVSRTEREHAYLCAWIVVEETMFDDDGEIKVEERPVVKSISVFSESSPECLGKGSWATLLESEGVTYADAIRALRSTCEQWQPWLVPHILWKR